MGKKYIIELEDKPFNKGNGDFLYRVKGFNSLVFDMTGIGKLTPYTEPDMEQVRKEAYEEGYKEGMQLSIDDAKLKEEYQRGLNDAREGKASCQFCEHEMCSDRFDPCRVCACTYMNLFEPKKQEKEEQITKGDVVRLKSAPEIEIFVTYADYEYVGGIALTEIDDICKIGDQYTDIAIHKVEKTGRHYEIAEVLRKMREGQEQ